MKKLYAILGLLCLFSSVNAQQNIPTVSCMYCGGTGRAGYTFCIFCGGSGRITDPQYQNQKAYQYGKSLGICSRGQIELVHGNYSQAFASFSEAMELQNIEAIFFLGVCYELGMGVEVNHELANDCYSLASKYGNMDATQAIARINQNGYNPATEQMRQKFRSMLKMQLDIKGQTAIMNREDHNRERNSNSQTRSSKKLCPYCDGTKYEKKSYTASASWDSYYNSPGQTCPYCYKKYKHYHYKCTYCDKNGYIN